MKVCARKVRCNLAYVAAQLCGLEPDFRGDGLLVPTLDILIRYVIKHITITSGFHVAVKGA